MRPIGVMAGVTILICIFAAVLAYFITSGMVSSRIERLTHFMQEVQEGSMDMQMESDDRDEIGMLYRGFGSMMKRIRTLINEVYLSKITQKEAELKALQAQINPHFLYNTLSLINWKALAAGEEDISRMTLALSTFYRTALNRGRNVLQVETELSNTRAYLEIQSMLHDGDFDYEIEAQTEILQCESLNLILQPLVENAIHHGIEEKTDGRGKITVRGWKEDNCVWFMVEDNGVGMEQEVADKILTMESKGYGSRVQYDCSCENDGWTGQSGCNCQRENAAGMQRRSGETAGSMSEQQDCNCRQQMSRQGGMQRYDRELKESAAFDSVPGMEMTDGHPYPVYRETDEV